MPPLRVLWNITTRPFASDDLQLMCIVLGIFRGLQIVCSVPVWIQLYVHKLGTSRGEMPWWCEGEGEGGSLISSNFSNDDDDDGLNGLFVFVNNLGNISSSGGGGIHNDTNMDGLDLFNNETFAPTFLPTATDGGNTTDGDNEMLVEIWTNAYLFFSAIVCLLDISLMAAIWSACGVGTPTQYMGRDKSLRPLLMAKVIGVDVMLGIAVALGTQLISVARQDNYGCIDEQYQPRTGYEGTAYYVFFCIVIATQAFEFFLLPAILVGKSSRWIRRHNPIGLHLVDRTWSRANSVDVCLTGCFQCCGLCCCCKQIDITDRGEMKDAAEAVLDFFGDTVRLCWSDMYIAIALLERVQRAQRFEAIQGIVISSRRKSTIEVPQRVSSHNINEKEESNNDDDDEDDDDDDNNNTMTDTSQDGSRIIPGEPDFESIRILQRKRSIRQRIEAQTGIDATLQDSTENQNSSNRQVTPTDSDPNHGIDYKTVLRKQLVPHRPADSELLYRAIRYAKHSQVVYGDISTLCQGYAQVGFSSFQKSDGENYVDMVLDDFLSKGIQLDSLGLQKTILAYSNFVNGIHKTPYSISIDEDHQEIILAIRGSASIEDAITDLQLVPSDLTKIAEECEFEGSGEKCHKGVLTRCKWIFQDLERNKVLRELLTIEEAKYEGFRLIITGHSLGAGCAAILACMLRKQYPSSQCFAFCPPGGLMTEGLSLYCQDFVTSFVNGDDIIPRMSLANCETLRDEALEVLARVRVSKIQVYRSLRIPHSDAQTSQVNDFLLYPPNETPRDTEYYANLEAFRKRKQEKYRKTQPIRLCLPGKILYLQKAKRGQRDSEESHFRIVAQWAKHSDFDEIVLSKVVMEDHFIEGGLLPNLEGLLESFQNPKKSPILKRDELLDNMFDLSSLDDTQLVLKRNFICCSLPHGWRSLLAALATFAGLLLSLVSFNNCSFVNRTSDWSVSTVNNTIENPAFIYGGIGVATGIYNSEETVFDGIGDPSDPESYEGTGRCQSFPKWFQVDSYLRGARALATLSNILGSIAFSGLGFTTCLQIQKKTWHFETALLILIVLLQIMVPFLVFESDLCTEFLVIRKGNTFSILSDCELSSGAFLGIVSAGFYLLAAVTTIFYAEP